MTAITEAAALSLWEIAHRWHNRDPNKSTATDVPLEVQDTLRFLAKAMYDHELRSCNERGIENWIAPDVVDFKDYEPYSEDGSPVSEQEKFRQWHEHREHGLKRHNDLVESFETVFVKRRYNPEQLDSVYIFQPTLWEFCRDNEITPPSFWFDGKEYFARRAEQDVEGDAPPEQAPQKVRQSEINKASIQAIARTLWLLNPTMTITEMLEHQAILIFGNGKLYSEKYLRTFISEVDPRDEKAKRGRPKKEQ